MSFRLNTYVLGFVVLIVSSAAATCFAAPAASNTPRKPLLTLRWTDAQGQPAQRKVTFDELEAMPQHQRTLQLPEPLGFSEPSTWQGVGLDELLKLSNPNAQTLQVRALNGYFADVPVSDIDDYAPILAYRRDGKTMSIRERGPLILIYPFNQFEELDNQIYLNRSVWQINEIRIE